MRILYCTFILFALLSCNDSKQTDPSSEAKAENNSKGSENSKWTDEFLQLKKAITAGDKKSIKSFIDFPIKNYGNEIWYLADSKLVSEISGEDIKPFTEADFDKYFASIFTIDLRQTLDKLKAEEFFKTGKSESPEIEVVKGSKSKLEANYEKADGLITLSLLTSLKELSDSDLELDSGFAIVYEFDITPQGKIKFRQVRMAG